MCKEDNLPGTFELTIHDLPVVIKVILSYVANRGCMMNNCKQQEIGCQRKMLDFDK